MSNVLLLKRIAEKIPKTFSSLFVKVPYSFRLGPKYVSTKVEIDRFETFTQLERKKYIFNNMKNIVEYVSHNIKFYKDFYSRNKFDYSSLKCFDDLKHIPIVRKSDLKKYILDDRSFPQPGRFLINTGGTSGEPLEFYADAQAFAREWAHMHYAWSQLSYVYTDLKLTFRGKNLGSRPLLYNPVHNEYYVNQYIDMNTVCDAIDTIAERYKVVFLHGYPSSIYNFAAFLVAKNRNHSIKLLKKNLKGILLGSEFPAPVYRDLIESTFEVPTMSWYGHSEMAVFAYEENEKYLYSPMHTYGYCEAVLDENNSHHLIGTSYFNTASPFIRYDTGDTVLPEYNSDLLEHFSIDTGRVGEFILDASRQPISLTALIFGRHHSVFGKAKFIQVSQREPGIATIMVTFHSDVDPTKIDWDVEFDCTNVDVEFDFEVMEQPIYTSAGKIPLLINA